MLEQVDATLTIGSGGRKLVGGRAWSGATRSVLPEWLNPSSAAPAIQFTTQALEAGFTTSQIV